MNKTTPIDISQWSEEAQVEFHALEEESKRLEEKSADIKDKMYDAKDEGDTDAYDLLYIEITVLRSEHRKLKKKIVYRIERNGDVGITPSHEGMTPEERLIFLENLEDERSATQGQVVIVRKKISSLQEDENTNSGQITSKNKELADLIKKRKKLASRISYHKNKVRKEKKGTSKSGD